MSRLRIFTVHINPALPHPYEAPVFVQEGFLWKALFFSIPWLLYQRLWLHFLGAITYSLCVVAMTHYHIISVAGLFIMHLGMHLVISFYGTDWKRARLKEQGYLTADIATGDSLLRAEQRYFDRYLAQHPTAAAI